MNESVVNDILFLLTIFAANVVQGITGFAGTLLALPFGMFLVNIATAKAVLNVLGLSSGVQICLSNRSDVRMDIFRRVLTVMIPGVLAGFVAFRYLKDFETMQRLLLGVFILAVGVLNLLGGRLGWRFRGGEKSMTVLLFVAGAIHGMFVCGGALLVVFMTRKVTDKNEFRATLSAIWLVLNSIILVEHIWRGYFDARTLAMTGIAVALVFGSVHIGGLLLQRMSQSFFVKLTNVLLVLSGLSLVIK